MHRYRVTVESLTGSDKEPLQFEVENHDKIPAIARRCQSASAWMSTGTHAPVVGFSSLERSS